MPGNYLTRPDCSEIIIATAALIVFTFLFWMREKAKIADILEGLKAGYGMRIIFRYVDLLLLGFSAWLITAGIFKLYYEIFDKTCASINPTNNIFILCGIQIIAGTITVTALQQKGWIPRLKTFSSWPKWPPIYYAVLFGLALLPITQCTPPDLEAVLVLSSICVACLVLAESYGILLRKAGPCQIKFDDAPIEFISEDTINREELAKKIASYWNSERRPKSGVLAGSYGTGKTSLVNISFDYYKINFNKRIIVKKITFWGHSERDIAKYLIKECLKDLSEYCDTSSLNRLGSDLSRALSGSKNLIERILSLFPNESELIDLDRLLGILSFRLIIVLEDIDREYPFSIPVDNWQIADRQQIHQIWQIGDQISKLSNIAVWLTMRPAGANMSNFSSSKFSSEMIDLDENIDSHAILLLIQNWMMQTGGIV